MTKEGLKECLNFWTRPGAVLFVVGSIFSWLNYYPHQSLEITSSGTPVTIGEVIEHWQYWLPFFGSIAGIFLMFTNLEKTKRKRERNEPD